MSRLEFVINSDLSNVALAAIAIRSICLYLGMNKTVAGHVELCITEALTNTIKHAYHGKPDQKISLVVSANGNEVLLEVTDNGTSMPLDQIQRLVNGMTVEEIDRSLFEDSGRGLQIMHDLMDRVAYLKEGGLNRLQLTKRIPLSSLS